MAQQETSNSFALLVDEDVDDVSTFLDRVAEKVKTSRAAEENKQNQNQQQKHHQQQPSRHRQSASAVKGGRWRGRGYQGHGSGRFGHGRNEGEHFGNGHQHNYREVNGHGGSDRYQHNYGGVNGSQRNYRGYSKYGGDSARYAGNHNGNGRGRGSGSEENNASGYEDEAIDSQQKPIQDAANGSGREQLNEFQGMAHGSESFKDDVRLSRNGNHKSGRDRRGYDGGNSNFRGQEGHYSYGGGSERNTRVELSNSCPITQKQKRVLMEKKKMRLVMITLGMLKGTLRCQLLLKKMQRLNKESMKLRLLLIMPERRKKKK